MFCGIMEAINKLLVHVCKCSISPCVISDKLQVSEVPKVSDIHIGGALVSEERDMHQLEQIYEERLVPLLLHLNYMTSLVSLMCLLKTLLENILQQDKSCMGTICPFHLLPCLDHISP